MKRILCLALAACCLTLSLNRPAQAWCKFNFGIGMNIGFEGGGNSVLWGLLRGANTPGAFDGGYGGYGGPGGYAGGFNGGPAMPAYAGGYNGGPSSSYPAVGYAMPQPMPNVPATQVPRAEAQPVAYFSYPDYLNNSWYYSAYYYGDPFYYPGLWYGY